MNRKIRLIFFSLNFQNIQWNLIGVFQHGHLMDVVPGCDCGGQYRTDIPQRRRGWNILICSKNKNKNKSSSQKPKDPFFFIKVVRFSKKPNPLYC